VRLLAQHVLGWDTARFLISQADQPPDQFTDAFERLVDRRSQREPLAYITGVREFWGLEFEVSPAVLIPRPETELLVEVTLERWPVGSDLRVADVCTGSGCVAVALAHDRPVCSILATDISASALELAARNAARHQVTACVQFLRTDLLEGVTGTFDLIVANPPYVPDVNRTSLQQDVRNYEPALALFGGRGGLDLIVRLTAQAVPRLEPGGLLLFEFGDGQEEDIIEVIDRHRQLRLVDVRRDLQGLPRTVIVARI
jgi:release factor glutamine methyltransferase